MTAVWRRARRGDSASGGDVTAAVHQGAWLLALRLGQYGFLFLASVVVARALGPAGRAEYALPLALATAVFFLLNLSLDGAAGRMLARGDASIDDLSRSLSAATLWLGGFGVLLTLGLGLALREAFLAGASNAALLLAALTLPATLAIQLTSTLLALAGRLQALGWLTAAGGALQLLLVIGLERAGRLTPELALAATATGLAATACLLVLAAARELGGRAIVPAWRSHVHRPLLRAGVALHPASLALRLNLRVDLFIVSALLTAKETGLYSLSATLAELVLLASTTWGYAAVRAQAQPDHREAFLFTQRFIRRVWPLAAGLALLVAVMAYPVIRIVYGPEWTDSALPLVILSFAAVAFALEGPARTLIVRSSAAWLPSAAAWPALVANVVLNLVLVPWLGITGAALASLVSYWAYAGLLLWLLSRTADVPLRTVLVRSGA